MSISDGLKAHVESGVTTLARCWALTRRDGTVMGFTDHDCEIAFGGITFRADTRLTARALQQTTGLAIDNSEALGALSDASVTEADIRAGRYDGAEVEAWLVNWANPEDRLRQFRGALGEITRAGGAFQAELVGLSEALNLPQGRVYQTPCTAVLGDTSCKVNLADPALRGDGIVGAVEDQKVFAITGLTSFGEAWFQRGLLTVLSGAAAGLTGVIRRDVLRDGARGIELWESLRAEIAVGDSVRLIAGCDKRAQTCKDKFANFINYRGFPDIPGEDRLLSIPTRSSGAAGSGGAK
ncbi:MAG TPA: DUF2163 domain-containing protein [Rhodobacterales bacterium]|nr:DUF2163 domain-containing protein [Rhodobacterales bacterium]